jgi:hypothetical protein
LRASSTFSAWRANAIASGNTWLSKLIDRYGRDQNLVDFKGEITASPARS